MTAVLVPVPEDEAGAEVEEEEAEEAGAREGARLLSA